MIKLAFMGMTSLFLSTFAFIASSQALSYDFKDISPAGRGESVIAVNSSGSRLVQSPGSASNVVKYYVDDIKNRRKTLKLSMKPEESTSMIIGRFNSKNEIAGTYTRKQEDGTGFHAFLQNKNKLWKKAISASTIQTQSTCEPLLSDNSLMAFGYYAADGSYRVQMSSMKRRKFFEIKIDPSLNLFGVSLRALFPNGHMYIQGDTCAGELVDLIVGADGKLVKNISRDNSELLVIAPNMDRVYFDRSLSDYVFVPKKGEAIPMNIASKLGTDAYVYSLALNSSGVVAGTWYSLASGNSSLFVWSRNSGLQDLSKQLDDAYITYRKMRVDVVTRKGDVVFHVLSIGAKKRVHGGIRYYVATPKKDLRG